ncbi:hypothetical protein AK812_SmicGene26379 [Symbiodinium microadriaticum]|uniref:Uncharacterized protein n=1 Tax=Symbiodinium microadriaticum TaxID=2951 RepID=A0A1Q9D9Q0_SYMMI|nr:hypothetical protein AK812_SmicGene26379 [Symbiodinium microadriaticum]
MPNHYLEVGSAAAGGDGKHKPQALPATGTAGKMPQGISAAEAVLNALRGSGLSKAAGLEVAEFPHGGTSVRGMRSKDHIAKAQKILEVPKPALLTDELKLSEPRFRGLANPLGLYLAERRNSLQHQASTNDQVATARASAHTFAAWF